MVWGVGEMVRKRERVEREGVVDAQVEVEGRALAILGM